MSNRLPINKKTKRLATKKSPFQTRRKLFIALIITLLISGIASGFANTIDTDNSIHKATFGETIVMESETPNSGSPSDYNALDNLRYAAYKLHHAKSFRGETDGVAVADIKFTTYSQHLRNTRVVMDENKVFAETVSSSSLKNMGDQIFIEDDIVVFRPSTKVANDVATFSPNAYLMSFDKFSDNYGAVPNQISKHIINEKTILSVVDENAPKTQSALNSARAAHADEADGDSVMSYYVPESLAADENGNYKFTVTLDPDAGTKYYRNEVRTRGGADTNPKFYSVKITFEIDGSWTPIRVTTVENYDIAIPVLGAMNCTGTNIETFSEFNAVESLPEYDFYKPYIDNAKNNPDYVPPIIPDTELTSPADYLAAAFSGYLTGETPLVLTADIESDYISAYGLNLSLDLKTMDVDAMLGNLYVKRADGKIYVKLNDLNGYINETDFSALVADEQVKGILGGLGGFDFAGLLGDDMLGTVFGNCEMTTADGVTQIRMPFDIDLTELGLGVAKIDASIYIADETKALQSIIGKITIGGADINISAKPPRRAPAFPSVEGATDISGLLDFIPDIIATAQQKTFGIDGSVTVNGTDIGVSAYIDLTDGLKIDGVISALGLDIAVKYANDEIYVTLGNIEVRGGIDELPELITAISALIGTDGLSEYKDFIKLVMPTTASDYINMIKSLTVTDDALAIKLSALTVPVELELTRGNGLITGLSLGLGVDMLGIKLDAAANLALTIPEARDIALPQGESYITVSELAALVSQLKPYHESTDYDVTLNANVTIGGAAYGIAAELAIDGITSELKAAGTLTALGQTATVTYIDGIAYVSIGNIKLKLDTAELDALTAPIIRIINLITNAEIGGSEQIDINAGAILGAIQSITVNDDGEIVAVLALNDVSATAVINLNDGTVAVSSDAISVTATVTPAAAHEITPPENAADYVDLAALGVTIDKVADILEQKSLTATAEISIGGTSVALTVEADFADGLKLHIAQPELGLEIIYIDGDAYIALGEIRISGSIDDIPALIEALGDLVPNGITNIGGLDFGGADVAATVKTVLDAVTELTQADGTLSLAAIIDRIGISLDAAATLDSATVKISADGVLVTVALNDISVKPVSITAPVNVADYVPVTELIPAVQAALDILEQKSLTATAEISVGGTSVAFTVEADFADGLKLHIAQPELGLEIVYTDGDIYVALGEIRICGSIDDIPALIEALGDLVPNGITNIGGLDFGGDVIATVKSVVGIVTRFTESNGIIDATAELNGITALVKAATSLDSIILNVNAFDVAATVALNNITANQTQIAAPTNADDYIALASLIPAIDGAVQIYKTKAVSATVAAEFGGIALDIDVELSFANGLALRATENNYGLELVVLGTTAYVSYGNIKVFGTTADIPAILELLDGIIPEDVAGAITEFIDGGIKLDSDIITTVKTALGYIESLTENNGILSVGLAVGGNKIAATVATDLSRAAVCASINGTAVEATLTDITVQPQTDITVTGEFIPVGEIIAAAKPILPLASAQGLEVDLSLNILGTEIGGSVYIYFGGASTPFMLDANLAVGDVPVRLTLKDGMLYIAVADTLYVYEQATEEALYAFADKVEYAVPGFGQTVRDFVEEFKSITLEKLLGCVTTAPAANGFSAVLDMNELGMNIVVVFDVTTENGILGALAVDCDIEGFKFDAKVNAVITDGALTGLRSEQVDESTDAVIKSVDIAIAKSGYKTLKLDASKYIALSEITDYIAPIFDLITENEKVGSAAIDISATLTTPSGAYTTVTGTVVLSLDPIAVDAKLTLFADTDDEVTLSVIYTGSTVYVQIGQIKLSLDTAADFERLYRVLEGYLPEYINDELAKLLGLKDGASAFSDISMLADRLKAIATADGASEIMSLLFSPLTGLNSDSAAKTALGMVRIFERNGNISIGLSVMGITLNVTPILSAGGTELVSASLDTSIANCSLVLNVESFTLAESATDIPAPTDAATYVSVMTFAEAVDNAIGTFTKTDVSGNITFELKTFNFDYTIFAVETTTDEFGNTVTVKDDAGRDKPLVGADGKKVIDKTVNVYNKPGSSALKGKLVKVETTDEAGNVSTRYKLNLEAHIVLEMSSLTNSSPLTLDLYVVNNDEYGGIAFLDYLEGNTGKGERISIDYTSIMQIVAAALDILGVDDEISDMLLADYKLKLDTSVFKSMDIAGLDSVKTMVENIVYAVLDIKDGINDAKAAWDLFYNAGSIDALGERMVDIKAKLETALGAVKTAISLFGDNDEEAADAGEDTAAPINGKLVKDIVTGVSFESSDTYIKANVENSIATGTSGTASVTVTHTDKTIDRIKVANLDVNTAKLNDFDANFTAGNEVDITLPADYNQNTGSSDYSDFANIKHLLFDVMNTANMLEFEIGDANTATSANKIELKMNLISIINSSFDIRYNAKVRIIDQGEGAEPRYKTAAAIELVYYDCKIAGVSAIPNCTTRLYFYDNVLYVKGLEWYQYEEKNWLGIKTTKWGTRNVSVAYTVDQLGEMMSSENGMEHFLYEFVFYLVPITRNINIVITSYDLQKTIVDSVTKPSAGAEPAPTIATVFKGYSYNDGTHAMTIGLSELAEAPGSNMLGDLNVTLTGKNDGDTNILDNYISNASVKTSLVNSGACTITVGLYAQLRNTEEYDDIDGVHKVRSSGLTKTTDGYTLEQVLDTVIPNTQWAYIWA